MDSQLLVDVTDEPELGLVVADEVTAKLQAAINSLATA